MYSCQKTRSEFRQAISHSLNWLALQLSWRNLAISLLMLSACAHASAQTGAPIVGYVTNAQDGTVSLLAINTSADFSGPVGPPFFATALNGGSPLLIDIGKNSPVRIAATPAGDLVFVTNQGNNTISVIDTTTNQPLAAVIQVKPIGSGPAPQPRGIAVLQQGNAILLYVANQGDNSVSVIDVTNIKGAGTSVETARITTKVGPAPVEVAISPDGLHAYVLNNGTGGAGSVTVLNTAADPPAAIAPSPIAVGNNPSTIAASPDGVAVYVANRSSNSISVIFTNNFNTPPTTIAGITDPAGIAFLPPPPDNLGVRPTGVARPHAVAGTRAAFVTNFSASTVTEIDVEQAQTPFALPANSHPSQIAISPDGTTAFITDPVGSQVLTLTGLEDVLALGAPPRLVVGNGASGITLVASAPTTPVCGVSLTGTPSAPNAGGVCVPNTKALTMAFQVNAQGGAASFGCTGAGGGSGTTGSVCGDTGVVGGNEDYTAQGAAVGIYTVVICTNGGAPPDCGGGPSARQAIAIPSLTSPAIVCTQPAIAASQTLNVQASSSCIDSAVGLNNFTIPATPLQLLTKLDWNDGTPPVTTQAAPQPSPGNSISGTHTYSTPGTQTVTVTAIDNILDFSTPVSASSQVQNAVPVCAPTASIDGFQVTLSPNCTDDNPVPLPVAKIVIDWNVVPTQTTTLTGAAVNGSAPFTYPTTTAQTTYAVKITATDSLGASSVTPFSVLVPSFVPQGPNCSFSSPPVPSGLSLSAAVTCNVTATGDAISTVTVFWDKTGTVSSSVIVPPNTTTYTNTFTHTYPVGGTYNLSVTATDLAGLATATPGTATVTVSAPVPPVCTIVVNGTGGLSVSALGTCQDLDSPIVSVSVNFDDDTVVQGTAGTPNFSQVFPHTYTAANTYHVTISATDAAGLSSQIASQSVAVPSITVSAPPQTTVSPGGTLTFTITVPSGFSVANPPLTLSCAPNPPDTQLPVGVQCLFSPVTITPGQSSTLTIATDAPPLAKALRMPNLYGLWLSLLPAMLLLGSTAYKGKPSGWRLMGLCLVIALTLILVACGTNTPPVPSSGVNASPGTFSVLVQVTDAKLNHVGSNLVTFTVK
jgi:large repetitive protein